MSETLVITEALGSSITEAVPVSEAEAATGVLPSLYTVQIIKGDVWGSSGYWPAKVIEADGARTWPSGTHMYIDHPTESEEIERPERSIRDLAGVLEGDPVYDPNAKALVGKMRVMEQFKPLVASIGKHIGVSIRASATGQWGKAEGREGRVMTGLVQGYSVDLVTKAGAGGAIISAIESARSSFPVQMSGPGGRPKEARIMAELTAEQAAALTDALSKHTSAVEANTAAIAAHDAAEAEKAKKDEPQPLDAVTLATTLAESGLPKALYPDVTALIEKGQSAEEAVEAIKAKRDAVVAESGGKTPPLRIGAPQPVVRTGEGSVRESIGSYSFEVTDDALNKILSGK
jgi:hypothetical protein